MLFRTVLNYDMPDLPRVLLRGVKKCRKVLFSVFSVWSRVVTGWRFGVGSPLFRGEENTVLSIEHTKTPK